MSNDTMNEAARWGTEVWVGTVNPWECDRMGHLNTRFYLRHTRAGLATLLHLLGLKGAFAPGAASTLLVREQNIRFLKEARVGAVLTLRGALLELGETDARFGFVMLHGDGSVAASVVLNCVHIACQHPADDRQIPWPDAMRKASGSPSRLAVASLPQGVQPRGVASAPLPQHFPG